MTSDEQPDISNAIAQANAEIIGKRRASRL
jgi:hypothetical protein